jgi:lysophospholipase
LVFNAMLNVLARETPLPQFPDLPPHMLEPHGLVWGTARASDGTRLRWAKLAPAKSHSDCILVGGFCEFIEKYFETIHDLGQRGFTVWTFDWRGQGGSQRPATDPYRPQPRDLARDVADLRDVTCLLGAKTRPRIVIAHSMGAAIALKALSEQPTMFDAAVLCAPMLQVATAGLPVFAARLVAATACAVGFSNSFMPGFNLSDVTKDPTPESSTTSHDPVRCKVMLDWFRARPALRIDGITFSWYRAALSLASEFESLGPIATPMVFGVPGKDTFVDVRAIRTFAAQQPSATLAEFPTARHELFHERDDIRNSWFAAIDSFLTQHIARP